MSFPLLFLAQSIHRLANAQAHLRPEAGAARSTAEAGGSQVQCVVRCCADVEECPRGSVAQEPCAYGQSRGVMPFSCAYLAADASTRGRTSAWSGAIQSVIACHCCPSHCWNCTLPPPSWSRHDRVSVGSRPSAPSSLSDATVSVRWSSPHCTCHPAT